MSRIAIVVGHNKTAQGAKRKTDRQTEFEFNTRLADLIQKSAPRGVDVEVFHREYLGKGQYKAEIRNCYADVDRWGADCSIELHFNGAGPGASGTETLSSGSSGSVKLAQSVQAAMLNVLGLRNRGIKYPGQNGRGGYSLFAGACPAILIEPFFGSNQHDCDVADEKFEELAEQVLKAAREVF